MCKWCAWMVMTNFECVCVYICVYICVCVSSVASQHGVMPWLAVCGRLHFPSPTRACMARPLCFRNRSLARVLHRI